MDGVEGGVASDPGSSSQSVSVLNLGQFTSYHCGLTQAHPLSPQLMEIQWWWWWCQRCYHLTLCLRQRYVTHLSHTPAYDPWLLAHG